ncbi:GtrA family protein [Mycolicibacterium sp.]|uniref:GtrA family protein n=1 Tax=Mycolicibacterium sp. TaxID=2320850 RepID=UPI003D0D05D1
MPAPQRFHRWCERVVALLPCGLDRLIAPTFFGFCVINSATFAVDLALLSGLHAWAAVPYPAAVTVAYTVAFGSSYALNRYLNFRSHAPVGPQLARYVVVVVVNYLAFILALSSVLTAAGVDFLLARLIAGAGEAGYMYAAMRWLVFRAGTTIAVGQPE